MIRLGTYLAKPYATTGYVSGVLQCRLDPTTSNEVRIYAPKLHSTVVLE